jgi:uncharacterized protein YbjT (DUF2867 family)
MSKITLVLGGTGKTGKRVAERLRKLNQPVRIGSRNGSPAFDWENQSTWAGALKDVEKVYITFQPDLAVPGAVETIQSFVSKAKERGVQKLVLLSGRGEKEAEQCEQVVMSSGIDWTIARASWFSQNFSENYLLDSILAGHVALPTRGVMEPFVDADDIADVVTAALTNTKHSKKIYEITGPRLLTFQDAVREISQAAKFPIQYQEISISEYKAMLTEYNTPTEFIWLLEYLFTEVLDGRNANLGDGVPQALGRKATDFSDYVKRTVATGVWSKVGI